MLDIKTISNLLLYTTTRIVSKKPDGSESIGTGFFFDYKLNDSLNIPFIITNKHVIKDSIKVEFYLHETVIKNGKKEPSRKSFRFNINDPDKLWVEFPNEVDLCALPLKILINAAKSQNKEIFFTTFPEKIIPSEKTLYELSPIEDVKMVGYPIGLWDSINNFPILRSGATATHPAIDFKGKPIGLIDMAVFPGSSGSPILIDNQGSYTNGPNIIIGNRAFLIGILYAGPQLTIQGEIQARKIPTSKVPISEMNIPIHLGYYLKTKILLENKSYIFGKLNIK